MTGSVATRRTLTLIVFSAGVLVGTVGCSSTPARTAPVDATIAPLYERARIEFPNVRAIEESGDVPRIERELEALADGNDDTGSDVVTPYVRARYCLALAINLRFDIDNDICLLSPQVATEQLDGWIDRGLAEVDPILERGVGESDHYRLRSDLLSLRIRSMFSGARWVNAVGGALDRAEQLDPDNPWIALSRGKKYLFAPSSLIRDDDKAREYFQRACQLDPTWSEPYIYLSRLARLNGDQELARAHLEACDARSPNRRFVRAIRSLMAEGTPPHPSGEQ